MSVEDPFQSLWRGSAMLLAAGLLGCFSDTTTEFPPGIATIGDNDAPAPVGDADNPYPEQLNFVGGERDGLYWTHGRGFIHAPIKDVWAAMKDPVVVADRRKVDEVSFDVINEAQIHESFVVHNVVHDLITVRFDVTWKQSAVLGTEDAPEIVGIRFQKTFGSTVIEELRGSVLLEQIEPDVTEVQMVEHLRAFSGGNDTLESYLGDLFASVLARVRGQALPEY